MERWLEAAFGNFFDVSINTTNLTFQHEYKKHRTLLCYGIASFSNLLFRFSARREELRFDASRNA